MKDKLTKKAIAAAKARQRAITLHYASLNLQELEADAIGKLQAKNDFTNNFLEDLNP